MTSKSGFTLIELLVAITVIGILSVGSFTNFKSIQTRSIFQTNLNRIHTNLVQIKNSAFNERIGSPTLDSGTDATEVIKLEAKYVAQFEFDDTDLPDELLTDSKILTNAKFFYNLDGTDVYDEENSNLLLELDNQINNSNNLIIDEFLYLPTDAADDGFLTIPDQSFQIIFDAETKQCDFKSDGIDLTGSNLIKIPLKIRVEQDDIRPIRYLYLHKKSCLPEILTEDMNV